MILNNLGIKLGSSEVARIYSGSNQVYGFSDTALDLGELTAQTVPDLSGNNNDATLTSNVYFSTDGSQGKGIQANCSAEGSGFWRITGKVRSGSKGPKFGQINNEKAWAAHVTTENVWQDFSVSENSYTAASRFICGHAFNDDDPQLWSAADWSDIRLWKKSSISGTPETDTLVAHWRGIDSEGDHLEDYPVLDSSGNGYHGKHSTGVAGGGGETGGLQTMGVNFNRLIWFDGVDDYVVRNPMFVFEDGKYLEFSTGPGFTVSGAGRGIFSNGSRSTSIIGTDGGKSSLFWFRESGGSKIYRNTSASQDFILAHRWRLDWVETDINVYKDGDFVEAVDVSSFTTPINITNIGRGYLVIGEYTKGLIYDVDFNNDDFWDGSIQDAIDKGWTVNGLPTNFYPAAESATLDALGNPLDFTRPNARVLNGAVPGSYATVADSASRDSTNVFGAWVYYDGSDGVIADYSDGAGTVKIEIVSDAISTIGLTTPDVFVGDKTTAMANTDAVTEGWNYIFVTFADFNPAAATRYYGRIGNIIEYTEDKTITEAEKNRGATKKNY